MDRSAFLANLLRQQPWSAWAPETLKQRRSSFASSSIDWILCRLRPTLSRTEVRQLYQVVTATLSEQLYGHSLRIFSVSIFSMSTFTLCLRKFASCYRYSPMESLHVTDMALLLHTSVRALFIYKCFPSQRGRDR